MNKKIQRFNNELQAQKYYSSQDFYLIVLCKQPSLIVAVLLKCSEFLSGTILADRITEITSPASLQYSFDVFSWLSEIICRRLKIANSITHNINLPTKHKFCPKTET